ncbi:hypothetical protein LWI29_012297 [Acer saccharum]|uniref:Uncharacterized protein n=1 Tax=Acer saccharum TaxID=4024 RepID=A0AA39RJL5_ACESA|nr:hypothetical protein LWI29_012297 [Acer saccharum]
MENALRLITYDRVQKERENYEYTIVDGKFIHKQTGDLFDTKKGLAGAKWIFVFKTGTFHHSSFLAGAATLAAGRLEAEQGILKFISAYRGNYRPTNDMLGSFFSFLKEKGVNLDEVEVEIRKPTEDYSDSYNGSTSIQDANAVEVPTNEELPEPDVSKSVLENLSTESLEVKQTRSYNVSTSIQDANAVEVPTNSELPDPDVPKEVLENLSMESLEVKQTQTKSNYERTLSGGVHSPRGEVPTKAISHRINPKISTMFFCLALVELKVILK